MTTDLIIALDAMGGDVGPGIVIPGAELAAVRHPTYKFLLFGDRARIEPLLEKYPRLKARSEIRHSDVASGMDEKPSQALRHGRGKSGMWQMIQAVHTGEAHAAVSAGNTGALMAMSRFILKTLPGISRPAIAAIWPTLRSESIVLDVGASIGADAAQLVEFAIMGEAMARCLFGLTRPTVGLLNIGVEEVKGLEQVKDAARLLREMRLRHSRCCCNGRLHREHRAQDRRGNRQAGGRLPQAGAEPDMGFQIGRGIGRRRLRGSSRSHGPAQAQWRRFRRAEWRGSEKSRRHG